MFGLSCKSVSAAAGKNRRPKSARTRNGRGAAVLALEELESRLVPTVAFQSGPADPVGAPGRQLLAYGTFKVGQAAKPGLVVTTSQGFSLMLGDGQGNFGTPAVNPTTIPNTALPEGIVTGDFENNGTTDVAVASYGGGAPGAVTIWRYTLGMGGGIGGGKVTPTFTAIQRLALLPNAGPTYLATADLNHDGKLDLLVADFNNNSVIVFLGNGDGTFGAKQILTGNNLVNPEQIVVADFNGDGIPDFAAANKGNGSVSVFQGNGDGTFTAATNVSLQTADGRTADAVGSVGLAAGDLDGDGKPDLAVANYGTDDQGGATLSLIRNTSSNGGIAFAAPVEIGMGNHLLNVVIADFNGDGKNDLAVTSAGNTDDPNSPSDNRVFVLVNQQPGVGQLGFSAPFALTAGTNPVGLIAQDVNGDGRIDLLTTNQDSSDVSVFLNKSSFPANPPPANGSALHVVGNQLKDANGNTVVLRGVNIAGLESTPGGFTDDNGDPTLLQAVDVALNDWHANLIRLTVNEDFWLGYDNSPNFSQAEEDAYRGLVQQVVSAAQAHNAYVMLAMWGSDMGSLGAAPAQHDMPDDNTTAFWQSAAAAFANNPAVMFDPYNEPHDVSWDQWRNGGQIDENGSQYDSPGMQGLLNTIRGTGAKNIVAAEGLGYASDLSGLAQGYALTDPTGNLMYQFHLYPGDGQTDSDRDARVQAVAAQYPVYVGEWGTYSDADTSQNKADIGAAQPSAAQWSQTMLAWLEQHQYSWTAWDFSSAAGPYLITDYATYTPTDYFGQYVKDALIAENGVPQPPPPATPAAPTGLQATAGNGQVTLTWTASAGATSYSVYRTTEQGFQDIVPYAVSITSPSFTDTAAVNGTTYYYTVVAENAAGASSRSLEVSATPQAANNPGLTANQHYVEAVFQAVLNRAPDAADLATWSNLLDAGAAPAVVSNLLTHSAEYYSNLVTAAYVRYLGRQPEATGLAGWVQAMQNGLTDEQMEANFIGSAEYIQDHGGTGEAWVEGMYHDLLGRTPAQVEVDGWVNALDNGDSPQNVAYGFAASAEREGQRVTADYLTYLGRQPAPSEVNAWVNGFLGGLTNEDVIAGFVGSPEYYLKHSS